MKTIKTIIIALTAISFLMSCDTKEKERLQTKVDSLNVELQESNKVAATLNEVGVLIDSIDASRQLLKTSMVEGTSYTDYSARLKEINNHVRDTKLKIEELQKKASRSTALSSTIKRLKADLELSTQQIAALQGEVERVRGENQSLMVTVSRRDSVLSNREEVIKMRQQDIAALETNVVEINEQAKLSKADLYFEQAEALELAASRTKFAPRKKKETKREALELYKLSLSFGKQEAQSKIDQLEKEIS
jgi:dynactin complex subunit